jgi:general secretion pathway protein B
MSYILEALKKADADRERERAGVPDLRAQLDAAVPDVDAVRQSAHWRWAVAVVAALLVAVGAWQWFDDDAPPPPETVAPAAVAAPTAVPAAVPLAVPAPVAPAQPASPTARPAPAVPAPARAPAQITARPAAAAPRPAPAPKPVSSPASATADAKLYALAELPPDVRAQLPALAVGGSVYSPAAASRIVILNGQVFREGDQPVDGLSVEQIRLKSTVLAFRGYRIELKH